MIDPIKFAVRFVFDLIREFRAGWKNVFPHFTSDAIKVMLLAQEESRLMGHNFVGTEQILLGLIGEGAGIAARTLDQMGLNLRSTRLATEEIIGHGSGLVAEAIPFTPRAKRVLEFCWDEARQLGDSYVGTEHLLLGLIRDSEGVAAKVLENLNVDLVKLRSKIIELRGEKSDRG
jgi:ATP-dependent Clp protease ATP-binding subunit ClpC